MQLLKALMQVGEFSGEQTRGVRDGCISGIAKDLSEGSGFCRKPIGKILDTVRSRIERRHNGRHGDLCPGGLRSVISEESALRSHASQHRRRFPTVTVQIEMVPP